MSAGEWADRVSLELPGTQPALLQALNAAGVPLIVLLISGRPVTFGGAAGDSLLANVSSMLASYPPGQVGSPSDPPRSTHFSWRSPATPPIRQRGQPVAVVNPPSRKHAFARPPTFACPFTFVRPPTFVRLTTFTNAFARPHALIHPRPVYPPATLTAHVHFPPLVPITDGRNRSLTPPDWRCRAFGQTRLQLATPAGAVGMAAGRSNSRGRMRMHAPTPARAHMPIGPA